MAVWEDRLKPKWVRALKRVLPKVPQHMLYRSEQTLMAELYFYAKLAGIQLALEVCVESSVHRSKQMRVDAAVIVGDKIVCVIECKQHGKRLAEGGRQFEAYASLTRNHGIPVIWVNDYGDIDPVVSQIRDMLDEKQIVIGIDAAK